MSSSFFRALADCPVIPLITHVDLLKKFITERGKILPAARQV